MKNSLLLLPFFFLFWACGEAPSSEAADISASPYDSTEVTSDRSLKPAEAELRKVEQVENEPPARQRRAGALMVGAEVLFRDHLVHLKGKKVGLVANHTSLLEDGSHLVDGLIAAGVDLQMVFAPEHGFRGTADAGESVKSGKDAKTGLQVISLYGKNKKPTDVQLIDLDLIIFDIQDVGTRFYTYISTMSYVMEACAENNIRFWVLDRPNPNGWYVDGPVLDKQFSSFIGLHSIPIVHGMTVGEYAIMVNEEGWLRDGIKANLTVIPTIGYTHPMRWEETGLPWVAPSPNLATEYAAYLYPAICWFEPTPVSVGRGTDDAFTMVGAPWYKDPELAQARMAENHFAPYGLKLNAHSFLPVSLVGKSKYPKHENKLCQGVSFEGKVGGKELFLTGIMLMERFYQQFAQQNKAGENFFDNSFERWSGDIRFQKQIASGMSPEDIWNSWQGDVEAFKVVRGKYLLYD
jgi:uncharacterized protein YbbC (DUF1343 family)